MHYLKKPLPFFLLSCFSLSALGSPVAIQNDTFEMTAGVSGTPTDWNGYPPPNGDTTRIEATDYGVLMTDADSKNGLGIYQWVPLSGGHKYRFTLDTMGSGGVVFQIRISKSIIGKISYIERVQLNENRVWADAGQLATVDIITPLDGVFSWLNIYSPKSHNNCQLILKSVALEDLGAASEEELTALANRPVTKTAPKSSSMKRRPAAETLPAGTIKVINFETGDLSQIRTKEGGFKEVVSTPEPVRSGKYSLKTQMTHDVHRTEITSFRSPPYGVAKYGWSLFIPEDFDADSWFSIVTQWHTWGTGKDYSFDGPPTALIINKGAWRMRLIYQDGESDRGIKKNFELGSIDADRGKWTDFVMDVNWQSPKSDKGYLKLYKDGELIIDYQGPTWFEEMTDGPFFKMGIYRGGGSWKGDESKSILYFDEFRMGDSHASLDDVKPKSEQSITRPMAIIDPNSK